jgi:hypothetical protein
MESRKHCHAGIKIAGNQLLIENFAVLFHEFFNPARRIDQFLLAGEKRMTTGANFYLYFLVNRSHRHLAAAGAGSDNFVVLWMNIFFHRCETSIIKFHIQVIGTLNRTSQSHFSFSRI